MRSLSCLSPHPSGRLWVGKHIPTTTNAYTAVKELLYAAVGVVLNTRYVVRGK
jgi:hypothetical protein